MKTFRIRPDDIHFANRFPTSPFSEGPAVFNHVTPLSSQELIKTNIE